MKVHRYYVYILSNRRRTVLYVGMTNDLTRRVAEHKAGRVEGFTKRYRVRDLLWVGTFRDANDAVAREKQLKNWHRDWKWNLVRQQNPNLVDLADAMTA
ncbi:MAG: GIY-YIG nuclease family protein [Bacteroidota bacterium]